MSFNKYIRKNARMLIMVTMSLLLVAFLVQDAISGCQQNEQYRDVKLGEAFGRDVTTADLLRAQSEMNVLRTVGMFVPPQLGDVEFMLLMKEARHMGVRISRREIEEQLQLSPAALAGARQQYKISLESIYDLIGVYGGAIYRLQPLLAEAAAASGPRVQKAFRDQTQQAVCKLSILDARAFADTVAAPTEEEIAAHFEAAKDRVTAHLDDALQFGYRLGDRVQVEYLTVDPKKIELRVHVKENEVREHFQAHAAKYVKQVLKPTTTQSTQTSQPAPPQFEPVPMTYEEAKEQVRKDKRALKAVEEAQRLMNDVERAAREPWLNAKLGDDHFLVPPEGAAHVSFEELSARFSKQASQYPVEYVKTELLDSNGLLGLPGIGRAAIIVGRARVGLADLALRVKGLGTTAQGDPVRGLNVMEPSPLLSLIQQNRETRQQTAYQCFIMRVVGFEKAGPPALDAVRDKVVKDARTVKAFAAAGDYARKIHGRAEQVGLDAAVGEMNDLRQLLAASDAAATTQPTVAMSAVKYVESLGPNVPTEKITRASAFLRGVGNAARLAKALFEASEATTQAAHRVVVVPIITPQSQKWLVAEFVELKPLYEGEFADQRKTLAQRESSMIQNELMQEWFDAQKIHQRTGFRPEKGSEGLLRSAGE